MVRILADSGEELAIATLVQGEKERLTIERVLAGKGRLLHYYFGKGRRVVHLEEGDFILTGTISTQWLGAERLWQITLARPDEAILPMFANSRARDFIRGAAAAARRTSL